MLENIQRLPPGQRLLIFLLIFGGGVFLIIAVTILLIRNDSAPPERAPGQALVPDVTVHEFAALPDDDAFPAVVTVATDGRVYTGSYATGALWVITADGQTVTEIPGSRDAIGAVAGLGLGLDGSLFIVDQVDTDPATTGGDVKHLAPDGTLNLFAAAPDAQGFLIPDDVAVDSSGYVYISDRGRDRVFRFNPDGSGGVEWWSPPALDGAQRYDVTGLAFDALHNALIVTDGINDTIYRVSIDDPAQSERLYWHAGRPNPPGLDGVTVTPQGEIYVAALAQVAVAWVNNGLLNYVAGLFRGSSDVDYSAPNRLYVANWDQAALARPSVRPRLPFAIDLIEMTPMNGE
ncbi:MAG: hypothetical protein JNM70_15405 [Anaerolineae bacterium]|nr:hypothetical protein [Anaerolineae bacterium]